MPFTGRVLTREAPGGYDHCCEIQVASLHSYRPTWQAVLDRELCEVAGMVRRLQSSGPRAVKPLRVDGVVAQTAEGAGALPGAECGDLALRPV